MGSKHLMHMRNLALSHHSRRWLRKRIPRHLGHKRSNNTRNPTIRIFMPTHPLALHPPPPILHPRLNKRLSQFPPPHQHLLH